MKNYKDRRDERRFGGFNKKPISMAGTSAGRPESSGAVLGRLEKARDALTDLVKKYVKHLSDKTIPEKKTASSVEEQIAIINRLPELAQTLNKENTDEGTMSLITACLNSIFYLRNEVNKAQFQNIHLYKKIEELNSKFEDLQLKLMKDESSNEDNCSDTGSTPESISDQQEQSSE